MNAATTPNTDVVDALVRAYNAHDADAFAELFAEDAVAYDHPGIPAQRGREEIRAVYRQAFARFPDNRTVVVHRIVMGDYVIDHERVQRHAEAEPFDTVAVNEVRGGLIRRLDVIRAR